MPTKAKTERTVRVGAKKGKVQTPRTEAALLKACGPKGVNIPEVAETLIDAEVELLIQSGAKRNEIIKEQNKGFDILKKLIKAHAELVDETDIQAPKSSVSIGPSSSTTTGTATELAALLKAEGKLDLFDSMVSVKISEVKKYLGEEFLIKKGFIKIKTEKFSKVSFKRQG